MLNRLDINDSGIQDTFTAILKKDEASLDAGEANFLREMHDYLTDEEAARFPSVLAQTKTQKSEEKTEEAPETEPEEVQDPKTAEEAENGTHAISELSMKEIKDQLTKLGVPFKKNSKRDLLEGLLSSRAHVVTEEDIKNNPDSGLVVGETVFLPWVESEEQE